GDDISVEIVDLRSVLPWDREAVLESVRKTSKVLVLHEDTHTGGSGAEIAATIAEEAFEDLDAPVRRITAPDSPVPFSPSLEPARAPEPRVAVGQPSGNGKFVSPVVARIAAEHGVDPGQVPGTGQGGRVTKKDILAFIESGAQPAAAPTAPVEAPPEAPPAP